MNLAVIGAGAWGTAFSMQLASAGHKVLLWVYEPDLLEIIRKTRENTYYLPGVPLPENIDFTGDLEAAAAFSDDIVIATPSFALRPVVGAIAGALSARRLLVITKGLERATLFTMSRIVADVTGKGAQVAVLSGPSFALEVARGSFHLRSHSIRRQIARAPLPGDKPHGRFSRLHDRRHGRRGAGRGAQERHGHRGGHHRGPGPRKQHACRVHDAGAGGDQAPRGQDGSAGDDVHGAFGHGGPDTHLHRPPEQEQDIRHRAGEGRRPRRPDSVTQGRSRRILHDCGRTEAFARGRRGDAHHERSRTRYVYAGKDIRTAFEDIRKRDTKDEDA